MRQIKHRGTDTRRRRMVRVAIVYTLVAMFLQIVISGGCFYGLITLRRASGIVRSSSDESAWGLGQILALFAWMPLLVELGYSVVYSVWKQAPSPDERMLAAGPTPDRPWLFG
jgi:hypothetical protein